MKLVVLHHEHDRDAGAYRIVVGRDQTPKHWKGDGRWVTPVGEIVFADQDPQWFHEDAAGRRRRKALSDLRDQQLKIVTEQIALAQ